MTSGARSSCKRSNPDSVGTSQYHSSLSPGAPSGHRGFPPFENRKGWGCLSKGEQSKFKRWASPPLRLSHDCLLVGASFCDYASTRMRHPEARLVTVLPPEIRHPEARRFFQPSEGSRAEHTCTLRVALSVTNEHCGDPRKIPRSAGDCASTRNASSRSSALFPGERGISRAAYFHCELPCL